MKPTSSGCCSSRFLQGRQHVSYELHASPARRMIGCLPIAKFMIPSYESWMRHHNRPAASATLWLLHVDAPAAVSGGEEKSE